jgi:hypothetical protein
LCMYLPLLCCAQPLPVSLVCQSSSYSPTSNFCQSLSFCASDFYLTHHLHYHLYQPGISVYASALTHAPLGYSSLSVSKTQLFLH